MAYIYGSSSLVCLSQNQRIVQSSKLICEYGRDDVFFLILGPLIWGSQPTHLYSCNRYRNAFDPDKTHKLTLLKILNIHFVTDSN